MVKRKQYIVSGQQYKVTAVILLYNVIAIFFTALLIFLPSFIGLSAPVDPGDQAKAAREILVLHKRFWPAILIVFLIVGTHSIFYFHRLFGPLYRFKSTLKDVGQGDLSYNFEIRHKDFLLEEKEVINDMVSSLRNNISELKQDNELLVESIHQLGSSLEDQETTMDSLRPRVKEIEQNADKVSQGFDHFKVT